MLHRYSQVTELHVAITTPPPQKPNKFSLKNQEQSFNMYNWESSKSRQTIDKKQNVLFNSHFSSESPSSGTKVHNQYVNTFKISFHMLTGVSLLKCLGTFLFIWRHQFNDIHTLFTHVSTPAARQCSSFLMEVCLQPLRKKIPAHACRHARTQSLRRRESRGSAD